MSIAHKLTFLRVVGFDTEPDRDNIGPLHDAGWSISELAETYSVSTRTIQRYLRDSHPCPGYPRGSCLTKVRGGGLCSFCVKTRSLA